MTKTIKGKLTLGLFLTISIFFFITFFIANKYEKVIDNYDTLTDNVSYVEEIQLMTDTITENVVRRFADFDGVLAEDTIKLLNELTTTLEMLEESLENDSSRFIFDRLKNTIKHFDDDTRTFIFYMNEDNVSTASDYRESIIRTKEAIGSIGSDMITNELSQMSINRITLSESLSKSRTQFMLLLLVMTGLLIFSLWNINKGIVNNIKGLQNLFRAIGQGELNYVAPILKTSDEFDQLMVDANKMKNDLLELTLEKDLARLKLEEYLYVDDLTGFNTRNYLLSKYKEILDSRDNKEGYMIYFDLKRFGVINESYGFDFGDKVLSDFSFRLISSNLKRANVFRYESDEFIIVLEESNKDLVSSVIDDIISIFKNGLVVEKIIVKLSFNFGISKYDINNAKIEETINHCKMALNIAKNNQLDNVVFYENLDGSKLERQLQIELSLDRALENKEFKIVFHPIVEMKSECIRGFEALSRWNSKELGDITPDEFIPILEKSYRIHKLDMHVINEAVKMTKSLSIKFKKDFVLSCNVSTETLLSDSFIGFIVDTLSKYKYEGKFLELEITESAIITDFNKVKKITDMLRGYGVRFSEDDFGDGFSSLNYLTRLDIDTLKVSKNLVGAIGDGFNNSLLFNSILTLANDLGLETVIEGVEDKKTLDIVRQFNCSYIQGFYYYKPLSFLSLSKVLEKANNND